MTPPPLVTENGLKGKKICSRKISAKKGITDSKITEKKYILITKYIIGNYKDEVVKDSEGNRRAL